MPSHHSSSGSMVPTGMAASVSRFTVGALSLALRCCEAGSNAVDVAISSLGLGEYLAEGRGLPAGGTQSTESQSAHACCPHVCHVLVQGYRTHCGRCCSRVLSKPQPWLQMPGWQVS